MVYLGFYNNLIELNELSSILNKPSVHDVIFVLPDSKVSLNLYKLFEIKLLILIKFEQSSKYKGDHYSFVGLTSITTKVEMTKSILDSFSFRIKERLDKLQKEMPEMKPNILW